MLKYVYVYVSWDQYNGTMTIKYLHIWIWEIREFTYDYNEPIKVYM